MDLNKVTLIGNMVRDPESRTLPSGQRVSRFSLATNYSWQDSKTKVKKEAVDFHSLIAWGRLAEILQQYVKKGSKLYVEGRLHTRQYVGKDGQNVIYEGEASRRLHECGTQVLGATGVIAADVS